MGAVSKEGAVSIITAAFPTISPDQARAIIAGVNVGTTIPTTKEEKQQITKDQGGDTSGGSTPPAPEPTTPPTAPAGASQKKSSLEILESLDPASIKMLIQGMMGGIELAKYDGIDFTPPEGARDAAKRALEVRETKPPSQRGMTPVGIARARDLQNGVKMSPDTVRRMLNFLTRHEVDKKGSTWDEQGKGWQAWNGWGGDAGYSWARKVVGQMEARDKKTEFVAGRDCGQDEGGTFGPDNECAVGYGRPPLKGGYTPTRPGGKFPKDYKRPTIQKQKEQAKKPQPPESPEKSKKEIPSSDKIKKGTAQSQAPDAKAVEWAKTIKSDKNDKKLFEDFTGSRFREINTNPEGQEGQRIISLINKQSSQTQKTDMYRGLSLKSEEDANRFFEGLRGGQTTNRTLTSFSPDSNKAAFFSFAKTKEPVSVFMILKSSKNLKALQGVSVESFEQEFVLTRGKRLRLIGEPRRKKNTLEFEIDVEEY
jgi:general stress protein YciG